MEVFGKAFTGLGPKPLSVSYLASEVTRQSYQQFECGVRPKVVYFGTEKSIYLFMFKFYAICL